VLDARVLSLDALPDDDDVDSLVTAIDERGVEE
jgi:hypothetical protein